MTAVAFDTISLVSSGFEGTAPRIWSITTDNLLSDLLALGAIASFVSANQLKVGDILFANYNVANFPSTNGLSAQFIVNGNSGGSLNFTSNQNVQISITLAEFLAMYDTPIQLVPAQGSGTLLIFKQLQIAQTYGSAALASGGVAAVQYDSSVHGTGVIASTTLSAATFQVTASSVYTMNPGVVVLPTTTTANKGLYLSCLSGDFTAGTASTFVANIWYSVIPSA